MAMFFFSSFLFRISHDLDEDLAGWVTLCSGPEFIVELKSRKETKIDYLNHMLEKKNCCGSNNTISIIL